MMIASLLCSALSTPPCQREPLRTELAVQVLDAQGAAVPGAEVICLSHEETITSWQSQPVLGGLEDWEAARERLGRRFRTDARRSARFERPSGALYLYAAAPGQWVQSGLTATEFGPVELRLEPDRALEVAVVGVDGKPRSGVAVELLSKFGDGPAGPDGEFMTQHLAVALSRENGRACFPHLQTYAHKQQEMSLRARLAVPLAKDVEAPFDPEELQPAPLVLVLPETGSVTILCSELRAGSVRLRRAPREASVSFWSRNAPLRAPVSDGKAEFSFVGLGLELEYELVPSGLEMPQTGRLAGPMRPGEQVSFRPPGAETFPVLVGRVIDEDRRALVGARLKYFLITEDSDGSSSRGGVLESDAGGRFRLALSRGEPPAGAQRSLGVRDTGVESLPIELSAPLPPGTHDCGDVLLFRPGSTRWLQPLSDEELTMLYRKLHASRAGSGTRLIETCLTEMVRRGRVPWERFLRDELTAARQTGAEDPDPEGTPQDLELLTTLRRVQGKSDPLALELPGGTLAESIFPEAPTIALELRNVDADRDSFGLSVGGSYRSGRFARCHVEVSDKDGQFLLPLEPPNDFGGGMFQREIIEPGHTLALELPLGLYVEFPAPGDYRARILYHDQADIDSEPDVDGWIVTSSPPFTVRILAPGTEAPR